MFCLGCSGADGRPPSMPIRSRSRSVYSPNVIDILRTGDLTGPPSFFSRGAFSTGCHFGVTSIPHLTHWRSDCTSGTSYICDAPSSPSDFVSGTEDVLAPRRTAAAMLFAFDSRLLPFVDTAAACCPLSLVSWTRFALRTVPVRVRSACL